jgi:hypothetical protein
MGSLSAHRSAPGQPNKHTPKRAAGPQWLLAAAAAVAGAGVMAAVAVQSLLFGGFTLAISGLPDIMSSLLLEPFAAFVHRFVPNAGSCLVLLVVLVLGVFQIANHVFHPPISAVFGGRPKITVTADHVMVSLPCDYPRALFTGGATQI